MDYSRRKQVNQRSLTGAFVVAAGLIFGAVLPGQAALSDQQVTTLDTIKRDVSAASHSYQLIESLTTEVGARMVGTPGADLATDWAVNKMNQLGFDKVWVEESDAQLWQRGDLSASITAPYPHKLVAIALGGSVGTNGKPVEAEVVYFANLQALQDAPANSLTGKIAYVGYRMERHIDGHGYGKAVGARVAGASAAAQKGAVAFVMRSVGTDTNRIAHTGMMRYEDGVKKIPAVALSNPDADLLENMLHREEPVKFSLTTNASGPTGKTVTIANVIGEVTGSESPDELITLGAHIDSWDVGTGAIDDGIGIGIVLAAGHYIANMPTRPARTIRVILFAAEEIGLVGVRDYVARHKDNISNHMIGAEWDFGNGRIYQLEPGVGPSALNSIRDFATYLAPMGVALAPTNTAKGQSDMSLLGAAGQPAVNFAPDGLDYFDYHHTDNDTLDKVDQEALKVNTAIYTLFAWYAASSEVNFHQ
ncbi:M28 family peptidase [Alteromonas gilva]|uniref:Carboxypeptidase Q n=1 Tax=Alteromonas gilva TaxID=2987522 RepID=A0ABT5L0T4_9ALTE|nr:M28 family peptidase [Alteromonas gilva]MDC8830639.1 M28 family peptidase [Alteromonas gilva]